MVHTEPKYEGAIDEPVPFAGTPEEAKANFATHHFGYYSDDHSDARCGLCDTKVWHQSASYPCGTDVPRQVRVFFTDGTEVLMTQQEYGIFAKTAEKI
jgi:hypothetical protein